MIIKITKKILLSSIILQLLSCNPKNNLNTNQANPNPNLHYLNNPNLSSLEMLLEKEHKDLDKYKAVSIDLGDPADQKVFVNYIKSIKGNCQNHVYIFNGDYFPIPWTPEEDINKIKKYALENAKRLDKILEETKIVHFSGHHYALDDFIFGKINFKDNEYICSAVNITDLSVHNETEIIFLNACSTVHRFRRFTLNLKKVFPNAIFLGYDSRSAEGNANKDLLREFFGYMPDKNIFSIPKRELAEYWIKAGKEIYYNKRKENQRDLRVVWTENNNTYELSSRN